MQRSFHVLLACLLVAVVSAASSKINADIQNGEIKRTIDLRSHTEEVITEIEMKNVGTKKVKEYIVSIPNDKARHLSFQSAFKRKGVLQVEPTTVDGAPSGYTFYKIKFAKGVKGGKSLKFSLLQTFTHVMEPKPKEISQEDSQLVVYSGDHYFVSPYVSESQTTTFKLASSNVISRSTNVQPHRKSKDKLVYGPYSDVEDFTSEDLSIHFENNHPFVTVKTFRKDIELSMWGNIAVEEHYVIANTGAKLKGSFSRFDYQRGRGQSGRASFRTVQAVLPAGAKDAYYRDHIGNISTSHFRSERDRSVLDLDPRFPMFGGWQTDFYIGYNLDASNALAVDTAHPEKYVLNMTFGCPMPHAVVDDATIRVILPEGATDISAQLPFHVDQSWDTHFTYLDTVGRPVLVLKRPNLVRLHGQPFQVMFTFPASALYKEPLLLVFGFFAFFMASMVYMRINLSLSADEGKA